MHISIITAYIEGDEQNIIQLIKSVHANNNVDKIICADNGYTWCFKASLIPNVIVGDFDSGILPDMDTLDNSIEFIQLPIEKDWTDLGKALEIASAYEPTEITIIGGIGGRLDHTIGNIQNIVNYSTLSCHITMIDTAQSITVQLPSTRTFEKTDFLSQDANLSDNINIVIPHDTTNINHNFSLFSYTPTCTNVSIHGGHYEVTDTTLTNTFPIAISNQFECDSITVSFDDGVLLVVQTVL